MGTKRKKLTDAEISKGLEDLPSPIGGPKDLAELLGLSISTIYEWISKGRLDGAMRKRGKHVLIWLNKAVDLVFNGPDWSKTNE